MSLLPRNWSQIPTAEIARLAPVEEVHWPSVEAYGVKVYCKRDELLHPQLSGNKFYKLCGHLPIITASSYRTIASFGGAYSNHLYALAAFGQALSLKTVGIIRGEEPVQWGATLKDLVAMGMELKFVSRQQYRERQGSSWLVELERLYGPTYLIDEGGRGLIAARGCYQWGRQALQMCPSVPDVICVAAGTGTSAAGLCAASGSIPLHVFCTLKGQASAYEELVQDIRNLAEHVFLAEQFEESLTSPSIRLETNYHCGGYAKFPPYLRDFVERFEVQTKIQLDPVYTAKMFWGIWQKIQSGEFSSGTTILVLHSGGLQGRRGFAPVNT